ncbi:MAG TPA: response regulator [Thermoanaerobaculia bacterium]
MDPQPKKILVIEDDEVIVVLISHILTRHSYVVHTTFDALEGEEMLARDEYDAILLDLKMPSGGVDFIRRIERTNPALLEKIIVVTAAVDEALKVAGLPLHAIVRKPFEIGALLDTVRACVNRIS